MRKRLKVVARFSDYEHFEKRFTNEVEAREYFKYLVRFALDGLVTAWEITLLNGSSPLASFNDYRSKTFACHE